LIGIILAFSSFLLIDSIIGIKTYGFTPILIGLGVIGIICFIDSFLIFVTMWKHGETHKRLFCFAGEAIIVLIVSIVIVLIGITIIVKGDMHVNTMQTTKCEVHKNDLDAE